MSFKELCPRKYKDMLTLLSDPGSVNVAFVFTVHSCARKVAIWAHSAILDQYPRFHQVFEDASLGDDGFGSGRLPAIVPIEGISMTTFCALLKYLYCEDLDLSIEPKQFLMCDMAQLLSDSTLSDKPTASAVLTEVLEKSNAAQFHASWEIKDKVTWSDLFLAADRFAITDLRQKCLKSLLESVDKNNALEILFGVGTCYKKEIRDPVMKCISEHLEDAFLVKTQDVFRRFADHEAYPEVMLGLLRLTLEKAAMTVAASNTADLPSREVPSSKRYYQLNGPDESYILWFFVPPYVHYVWFCVWAILSDLY